VRIVPLANRTNTRTEAANRSRTEGPNVVIRCSQTKGEAHQFSLCALSAYATFARREDEQTVIAPDDWWRPWDTSFLLFIERMATRSC